MDVTSKKTAALSEEYIHKERVTARSRRICSFWLAGRCNRNPCRFLHGKVFPSNTYHRIPKQYSDMAEEHIQKQFSYKARWPTSKSSVVVTKGVIADAKRERKASLPCEKVCKYWALGNCLKGDCHFLHSWSSSNQVTLLTKLQEHKKAVMGIVFPEGSDKLLSGSNDGTVRVWDSHSGQCVKVYNLGGEVGAFFCEGPWVFVGLLSTVKAWNIQSNAEYDLTGPNSLVHSIAVANDKLFAGTQDGDIFVWEASCEANPFQLCACLQGHSKAIVSFAVGATLLFSGSIDQTIRVWDSRTLTCLQTLLGHTDAVMSLCCWDQFVLSCSLDKTIKVWVATCGKWEESYTHTEDHGVLSLNQMGDADGNPVLFCACNDNSVCLYNLPSFTKKGRLFSGREVRTIEIGPAGLFFTGDGAGTLSVWKWLTETESKIVASRGLALSSTGPNSEPERASTMLLTDSDGELERASREKLREV